MHIFYFDLINFLKISKSWPQNKYHLYIFDILTSLEKGTKHCSSCKLLCNTGNRKSSSKTPRTHLFIKPNNFVEPRIIETLECFKELLSKHAYVYVWNINDLKQNQMLYHLRTAFGNFSEELESQWMYSMNKVNSFIIVDKPAWGMFF